jgi:adenine-specific DNA glycosylase
MDSQRALPEVGLPRIDDEAGWDPYRVWYTRVMLPRSRVETTARTPGSILRRLRRRTRRAGGVGAPLWTG